MRLRVGFSFATNVNHGQSAARQPGITTGPCIPTKNAALVFLQIRRLELGLAAKREAKAAARKGLRAVLKAAAAKHQQQLKHPSSALRISWIIDKGMWTMLADGEPFAEAEINNLVCAPSRSSGHSAPMIQALVSTLIDDSSFDMVHLLHSPICGAA